MSEAERVVEVTRRAELEAAIATVTRALGRGAGDAVELLVAERGALRAELCALRDLEAKVVILERHR